MLVVLFGLFRDEDEKKSDDLDEQHTHLFDPLVCVENDGRMLGLHHDPQN